MSELIKWVESHKKEIKEAHRYRTTIAKHTLCPIEPLFFSLMDALISDVENGVFQSSDFVSKKPQTELVPHNFSHSSGIDQDIQDSMCIMDQMQVNLRNLEIKSTKEGFRKTSIAATPVVLPIWKSNILLYTSNILKPEIPFTKIGKDLKIDKLILQDGTYIIADRFKLEFSDAHNPNIATVNYPVHQYVASRVNGHLNDIDDTLSGSIDFNTGEITLASVNGSVSSVVFSGSLLVEKI